MHKRKMSGRKKCMHKRSVDEECLIFNPGTIVFKIIFGLYDGLTFWIVDGRTAWSLFVSVVSVKLDSCPNSFSSSCLASLFSCCEDEKTCKPPREIEFCYCCIFCLTREQPTCWLFANFIREGGPAYGILL
ncbi:hypothetical protein KP509_02G025400 [Ceratopteris richardii]|uniref:Uncharacterized protein n=1 Tax=Ceratopteris richardii TaxID=49495 RepID=A0A8T2V3Y6_CERRI|nr:hypothetical protein KP509_02G025400 [Ceratopteris richardii]